MENLERAQKETEEFSEEMRQRVEKAKNMDISDLRGTVLQRFQELTDDEMGILETLEQHPVGEVIMKLIGPELEQIFSEPESETEQMLADDMPQTFGRRERAPLDEAQRAKPNIMPSDDGRADEGRSQRMYSAGPNTEQYRVDPSRPEFKRPRPEEVDPMMERGMASR